MRRLADDPAVAEVLDLLAAQTRLLLATAASLDDTALRGPSRLPGWSRGHVLTHLARNADALADVVLTSATGGTASMYPSWQARDAQIEAGAGRPAPEVLADLEVSADRFRDAFLAYPQERADVSFTSPAGWWRPVREAAWFRCREVVLHHVDLGTGFTLADTGRPEVAERLLVETVEAFTARTDVPALRLAATDLDRSWQLGDGGPDVRGPVVELVEWLTGRGDGLGLTADPQLPTLPAWA